MERNFCMKKPIKIEYIDDFSVEVYESRQAMGRAAGMDVAERLRDLLAKQEKVRVIFASAPSQNQFLEQLTREEGIDWDRVTAFHMDEYIGLPDDSPQLFSKYIHDHLFSKVNPSEVHMIKSTNNVEDECNRYGALINQDPIDIVCMGIGENGHIAFNDPPVADFEDSEIMKLVELNKECRQQQVNDGCFPAIDLVPTHALTLTVPTLLSARSIFCVVPGKTKWNAVQSTLYDPISTDCPATILRTHPNCTLYVDQDSFGGDK